MRARKIETACSYCDSFCFGQDQLLPIQSVRPKSGSTRIDQEHAVTSMQVQKKHFRSWLRGGGSTWLRGGSIEPVEPPLATGMDLDGFRGRPLFRSQLWTFRVQVSTKATWCASVDKFVPIDSQVLSVYWWKDSRLLVFDKLLGINCVADVVRCGRLRWFRYLEHKSVDDWVPDYRRLMVKGTRGQGRSRETWEQCIKDDMKLYLVCILSGLFLGICGGTWFVATI